jgi:hypothetical protein
MQLDTPNAMNELTVADTFGLVSASFRDGGQVTLINAILNGRKYNIEERAFNFMPLCVGDTRHYVHSFVGGSFIPEPSWTKNVSETILSDTMLGGERSYISSGGVWNRHFYKSVGDGVRVNDATGLKEVLSIPSHAFIGAIVDGSAMITDTGTVTLWGQDRKFVRFELGVYDYGYSEEWVEGIGMTSETIFNFFSGTETFDLKYAKLCGSEYGTPLPVDKTEIVAPLSLQLFQNYPNPFSDGTIIPFNATTPKDLSDGGSPKWSGEPLSLKVYDYLGREVLDLSKKLSFQSSDGSSGEVSIDKSQLPTSGMYFYRLTSGGASQTKALMFLR